MILGFDEKETRAFQLRMITLAIAEQDWLEFEHLIKRDDFTNETLIELRDSLDQANEFIRTEIFKRMPDKRYIGLGDD